MCSDDQRGDAFKRLGDVFKAHGSDGELGGDGSLAHGAVFALTLFVIVHGVIN